MDSRELVQLAKALTAYGNFEVSSVTVTVETAEGGMEDYVVTTNGDLFRPFHVGGLGFDDAETLLGYIEAS
jgi:hypothetical protein